MNIHKANKKEHSKKSLQAERAWSIFSVFFPPKWTEIENALNYNKNSMPSIRKCGFSDCEKQISWESTECNNCWNRKENYVCDACGQKQSYNISYLISVRDNLNDTELLCEEFVYFTKLPLKFHDKLKEIEKSLILTTEEEQAIEKTRQFRINFLREKNHGR